MKRLAFERLRIRRMPGIADGGFELEGLSPGLNVVHGPNASGKTTTAAGIEALLWPSTAVDRAWLSASLRLDGEEWTVEADGRWAGWQREGLDASPPTLPPPESRDRYRLSLHELLSVGNEGFAAAIARESAGGYDLKTAAVRLRPRSAPVVRLKESDALKEATARLNRAVGDQEALHGEERHLRDLEGRIAERARLDSTIALLERAVEHARARETASAAERKLAGFDPRMEALNGDEAKQLESIAAKLAEAKRSVDGAERDRERATAAIAECRLPEGGLPSTLVPALEEELRAVQELEREITKRQGALEEAGTRRARASAALGGAVDAGKLRELSTAGIESISGFASEAEKLGSDRRELEAQLAAAFRADDAAGADRETLDPGILYLRKWLQSAPGGEGRSKRLRALALAGAVASILLGAALALVHPALAVLALVGVVILVLALRVRAESDARPVHRAEFEKLGLDSPKAWSVESVESRLAELERERSAALLAEERARAAAKATEKLAALAPREEAIEARRAELTTRLGVDPRSSTGSLVWLVEKLVAWHDAQAAVEGAERELASAREALAARLVGAGERVASLTDASAANVAGLAGVVADLKRRQEKIREASGLLALARERHGTTVESITSLEKERSAIFARVGLQEAEEATLRRWCEAHAGYRAAREGCLLATGQRGVVVERLKALPGFDPAMLEEDEGILAQRLDATKLEAEELIRMREEAATIRDRIHRAKRSVAMEDAFADLLRCEDALREARMRDVRSAIADVLVSHLNAETRDHDRPAVFVRAREIFAKITRGRYRLELDGDSPAFRAVDSTTGRGHSLDELSSATRVQLLLAVRIAFVETLETEVQLPLILDETLGNSDDERALTIMEAVLELAASGRQIFYFTAQPDEVAKWREVVEGREIPCAIVDIARSRGLSRSMAWRGVRVAAPSRREIPRPEGRTYLEYGADLLVPAIDPFGSMDAVHLWYLVEDPETLHHLLSDLRAECWGDLRSLVEYGSASLLDPALLARLRARARAMEAALELRRIGRGLPVDRSVLVASGLVSNAFLDAVTELCRSCQGDAKRILAALDRREVKGFRTSARESLAEYFDANGYLDEREPLGPAALRAAALAAVDQEIRTRLLSVAEVDRILELTAEPLVVAGV